MFSVTREIRFCYGHRLMHHTGKCKHLHGHNGRAVVTLATEQLDSMGMVVDFGEIKQKLERWIDDHLDHRMLLHKDDPILAVLRQHEEPVFVMDVNPTAENIAREIFAAARELNLPVVEVVFWETDECNACFRESDLPGKSELPSV